MSMNGVKMHDLFRIKNQHKIVSILAISLLLGASLGCAATSRTEVRTTQTRSDDRAGDAREQSVEEKTTVTSTDAVACNGVLSCTVDFAGTVIAFPFRVVGGLASAIF
jgi:hypothetical protein